MKTETKRSQREPVHILIADDHELARLGLRSMLTGVPGLEVVAEARNGQEAVALCTYLKPRLAILDLRMPVLDGLAAAQCIRERCPQTLVVIISTHEHPECLVAAIQAGVSGYLLKDMTRSELLSTIGRVLQGASIVNGNIAPKVLEELAATSHSRPVALYSALTARENEILKLMVEGLNNREIAVQLGVATGTVKAHIANIVAKLGVADRTQAIVRAIREHPLGTTFERSQK